MYYIDIYENEFSTINDINDGENEENNENESEEIEHNLIFIMFFLNGLFQKLLKIIQKI